jgi:hypothetical protein
LFPRSKSPLPELSWIPINPVMGKIIQNQIE